MTKFLSRIFKNKKNSSKQRSAEEQYIISRNPQSISQVEQYAREFELKQSNSRTWRILWLLLDGLILGSSNMWPYTVDELVLINNGTGK